MKVKLVSETTKMDFLKKQEKSSEQPEAVKENEGVVEDMDAVMAPQEIGRAQFIKKNWDQAARANELELEGVMHITKRIYWEIIPEQLLSNYN